MKIRKSLGASLAIAVLSAVFVGGMLFVVLSANAGGPAASSLNAPSLGWTRAAGSGVSVPACSSASAVTSCSGGSASADLTWSYGGQHGTCLYANVSMGSQTANNQPCSGSYTFTGLSSNTAYNWEVDFYKQSCGTVGEAVLCGEANGFSDVVADSSTDTVTAPNCVPASGSVSASPNPCAIASGQSSCTSNVSWSTVSAPDACVFVRETGALFACGASGNQDAPWITASGYTFDLRSANSLTAPLLNSVVVNGTPATAPACTYTYSDWGACQPDGTQTRTVLTTSPNGCTGTPVTSQSCTYTPPACTYTYSDWGACQPDGTQTRTVLSSSPSGCTGTPVISQSCTYGSAMTVSLSANPSSGYAPLGVSYTATVSNSGGSSLWYDLDCTNDGTYDVSWGASAETSHTFGNACIFGSAGTYTTRVRVTKLSTSEFAEDTATISVRALPPPPVPTVSISANPTSIISGQSSTLSWTSTNADSCSINRGIGAVGTSGSRSVSPTITTIYSLTCTGAGGTASNSATVSVSGVPTLSASLSASPSSGSAPLNATLTASVSGTATGTINYTFYCNRSDSGTDITSPWDQKFDGVTANPQTASCSYPSAGTYTAKVIAERGTSAAQAQQTITVTGGSSCTPSTGSWSACSASCGGGTQTRNVTSSDCTATTEFQSCNTQTCPPGMPTAAITANGSTGSISISSGQSATIAWSSTNATSCSVSPTGWTGTSGTQSTGSLTSSTTYTASCTGAGGSASASVAVNVSGPPPSISVLANGNSGTIYLSQPASYLVTWSATNADSCTASGSWSGVKALSGSQMFSDVGTGIYTYGLFCTGSGGSAYGSVGVNVSTIHEIVP